MIGHYRRINPRVIRAPRQSATQLSHASAHPMHRIVAVALRIPWNGTERLRLPAHIVRACDDLDRTGRRRGDVGGEPPPGKSTGQRTELRGLPGAPAVAGELDLCERRVGAVGVAAAGEPR